MKTLDEPKIRKFKSRLYGERVFPLFRKGTKGMSSLKRFSSDHQGRPRIFVDQILAYFSREVKLQGITHADGYMESLFSLVRILAKEAEPYSFECGISVAEEAIRDASLPLAIELLTKNLLITFFSSLKTYDGRVDPQILSGDLSAIIHRSSAGRNYQELLDRAKESLTDALTAGAPWYKCLKAMNSAWLISYLTDKPVPVPDKNALLVVVQGARQQIAEYDGLLKKTLDIRGLLLTQEVNDKVYLKKSFRLDESTRVLMGKIDANLNRVHNFMDLTGLSWENMMGAAHKNLRENLSRLFLGMPHKKADEPDSFAALGTAGARYRLAILFCYPDITRYCRSFREDPAYQPIYMEVFRLLYTAVTDEIRSLAESFDESRLGVIGLRLSEIQTSVVMLELPPEDLVPEKEAVRDAFADLVRTIEFHHLEKVMAIQEGICGITQDRTFRLQALIRECLVEKCRMSLDEFSRSPMDVDRARSGILRRLYYHARHYRPQRRFYDLLFRSCVGSPEKGSADFLTGHFKTSPRFVRGLLLIFSDEKSMQDLLSPEQIDHARDLMNRWYSRAVQRQGSDGSR